MFTPFVMREKKPSVGPEPPASMHESSGYLRPDETAAISLLFVRAAWSLWPPPHAPFGRAAPPRPELGAARRAALGSLPPQTARLRRLGGPPAIPVVVARGPHTLPARPGPRAQQLRLSGLKTTPLHRAGLLRWEHGGKRAAGTERARPCPYGAWQA